MWVLNNGSSVEVLESNMWYCHLQAPDHCNPPINSIAGDDMMSSPPSSCIHSALFPASMAFMLASFYYARTAFNSPRHPHSSPQLHLRSHIVLQTDVRAGHSSPCSDAEITAPYDHFQPSPLCAQTLLPTRPAFSSLPSQSSDNSGYHSGFHRQTMILR